MAPLPTITGVHRVALRWRVQSSGPTAVNVMHFYGASTDTQALFNALDANVTSAMWLGPSGQTSVIDATITPLDGSSATRTYTTTGTKWSGTGVHGDYSPSTAVVVSLRTAKRGRRYRGRIYLPFVQEGNMTSGSYNGAVTSAQAAWDVFRAAMTSASFPLHIASYGHSLKRTKTPGGGYTLTPVTWTPSSDPVTGVTVEATFGTQRRRQSRLR